MKFLTALVFLSLSAVTFASDKCPKINGMFIDQDGLAHFEFHIKGNVLTSSHETIGEPGTPIILDGQKRPFLYGGTIEGSCQGEKIAISIRSEEAGDKVNYDLEIVKVSSKKLIISDITVADKETLKSKWEVEKI